MFFGDFRTRFRCQAQSPGCMDTDGRKLLSRKCHSRRPMATIASSAAAQTIRGQAVAAGRTRWNAGGPAGSELEVDEGTRLAPGENDQG